MSAPRFAPSPKRLFAQTVQRYFTPGGEAAPFVAASIGDRYLSVFDYAV
jgi:hypothetical protein